MEASGGSSLQALLHRLAALLSSAGRSVECDHNVAYARLTRPTTEHRNLPDVHVLSTGELNAYDVLVSDWVVFTEASLPGARATEGSST